MDNNFERYHRQIALPQLGTAGQQKLLSAKVLVIGAGGLGCPALQYLAGAGIGTLGIVDDDIVSLTNLHRQILFGNDDIGSSKALVATKKIASLNPDIIVNTYSERLTTTNALEIISAYDLIMDCTDNFATRYMINDACVLLKKPLVFGAINRFEGQVAIFNSLEKGNNYSTNYRDIFPVPPSDGEVMNCAEAGVLGVLAGMIGCVMASETIKFITGIGKLLINKMLVINILEYEQFIFYISKNTDAGNYLPVDEKSFRQTDYVAACNTKSNITIIGREQLFELLEDGNTMLVDVRELDELPVIIGLPVKQVPMSVLEINFDTFDKHTIILFCQSGKRSIKVAARLDEIFGEEKKIYSLKNGVSDIIGPVYKEI
jgi:molybdopterin/thiamine biosynthesis adenylyltransferase/rhodanese-related sulfurtransferase